MVMRSGVSSFLCVFLLVLAQDINDIHFSHWTEQDVGIWLTSISFIEYKDAFAENHIDGECLPELTESTLKELGITSVGHRLKILREVRRLQPPPPPEEVSLEEVAHVGGGGSTKRSTTAAATTKKGGGETLQVFSPSPTGSGMGVRVVRRSGHASRTQETEERAPVVRTPPPPPPPPVRRRNAPKIGQSSEQTREAMLVQASIAYEQGEYERSAEICMELLAMNPREHDAIAILSAALQLLEVKPFPSGSLETLKAGIDVYPNDTTLLRTYAAVLVCKGTPEFMQQGLEHLDKLLQLEHGTDVPAPPGGIKLSVDKLVHDIDQLHYLLREGLLDEHDVNIRNILNTHQMVLNVLGVEQLSPQLESEFQAVFNRVMYISPSPRVKGGALSSSLDTVVLSHEFHESVPKVLVIDDFLSPRALQSLLDFCLESTIWYESKPGFIAALFQHGFHSPLLLQIASELRAAFPSIFKDLGLTHMWAVKYEGNGKEGFKLHTDDSAVQLNMWLTPDEANLGEYGGMVIHKAAVPKEMLSTDFHNPEDKRRMNQFLKDSEAGKMRIPYKQNRAVLFQSNLYHGSDEFDFKPGFTNRRINVTFLFGRRPRR
eukprot:JP445972.1.p1 GENE.JP445972.1~~JP445972.1.p1  ORF type:complete len:602 (-),score=197.56 JP445972.1:761-2566(-)